MVGPRYHPERVLVQDGASVIMRTKSVTLGESLRNMYEPELEVDRKLALARLRDLNFIFGVDYLSKNVLSDVCELFGTPQELG